MGRKGSLRQPVIERLQTNRDTPIVSRAILSTSLKTGIRLQHIAYDSLLIRLFVSKRELDAASETVNTIDQIYRGQPADRPE